MHRSFLKGNDMRKWLLACTIAALPFAAHAELFTIGGTYNLSVGGTTGGDFTNPEPLQNGVVPLTNTLELTTTIVPTAGGGEWLVFNIHTRDGQQLVPTGNNFSMSETGLPAAVDVNFDQAFGAADINGVNQTWTGVPGGFTGYHPVNDPLFGQGIGAGPFTGNFPAGPLPNLFTFVNPFDQLDGCCGLNTAATTSYEQAWHFDPQQAPPSVPEPSTIALLGLGMLGTLALRRRQRHN
jgi:hypothetical protein